MQLSVKELSSLLRVTERTIYRWIQQKNIPFYRVHDQYRFNRIEIMDWATVKKMDISQRILQDDAEADVAKLSLAQAIREGGIHYRIQGRDKKALLGSVVNLLQIPHDVNKDNLLDAMLVREDLGSTGFGEGIAIPHTRYPIVTHIPRPIVSICFLENPVDYGAIDRKPVSCLFTVISPTVRSHLRILSQIAFVLNNPAVKKAIMCQMARDIILSEIEKAQQAPAA
ncbi:MAG: PTS sugar transporter subunit IIA [Candidatus Omnitrophica bacterium]|jgi:PTS system nitrogen regulatory IIA component|nr:PTS sugar transporter subunit IIA [Candidatus Omnitrophota bacterium]